MITRDQHRARDAYAAVDRIEAKDRRDYKILVNALGATIVRSGLAAAMANLERQHKRAAARVLLDDLAKAGIPLLTGTGAQVPEQVRRLALAEYMLATRETLRVSVWLKRAVQARFRDE